MTLCHCAYPGSGRAGGPQRNCPDCGGSGICIRDLLTNIAQILDVVKIEWRESLDDIFANEDEAAYDCQQEDAHG